MNNSIREQFENNFPCPDKVYFPMERNLYEPTELSITASTRATRQNNRWEVWQIATEQFKTGLKPKQQQQPF